MTYEDMIRAVTAAVAFVSMFVGHQLGDHWVQTGAQACKKSLANDGRRSVAYWHCVKHVVGWTATTVVMFASAAWWLHLPMRPGWLVAGVAVNAVTHYVADLRTPLAWIAERVGKGDVYHHLTVPFNGAYVLDQTWHLFWLFVAALLIAGP